MKTLLTSMTVLLIAGTSLPQSNRMPATKADHNQPVKVSALKLAEAKAFLSRTSARQNRTNPGTADGGI